MGSESGCVWDGVGVWGVSGCMWVYWSVSVCVCVWGGGGFSGCMGSESGCVWDGVGVWGVSGRVGV